MTTRPKPIQIAVERMTTRPKPIQIAIERLVWELESAAEYWETRVSEEKRKTSSPRHQARASVAMTENEATAKLARELIASLKSKPKKTKP